MKIKFRQTGGIVGIGPKCDIDTDALADDAEKTKLLELVTKSGIAAVVPAQPGPPTNVPRYHITIDVNGAEQTHTFEVTSVPANFEELIKFLKTQAKLK